MKIIHETLRPLISAPFQIHEDGTSQTKLSNNGRFGFRIEYLFGIRPNSDQGPDMHWGEIKTINYNGGTFRDCSIGNVSQADWASIRRGEQDLWADSFIFKKAGSTLFVFYEKSGPTHTPEYEILRYGLTTLKADGQVFQNDWTKIVNRIKAAPAYGDCQYGYLNNTLLSMSAKGNTEYVYPCIKFKPALLKQAWNVSANYMASYVEEPVVEEVIDITHN